jgi:hypothetical protein
MGSHIYIHASMGFDHLIYSSWEALMTGTCHHAQLFTGWEGGLLNFFTGPRLAPNRDPLEFQLPNS